MNSISFLGRFSHVLLLGELLITHPNAAQPDAPAPVVQPPQQVTPPAQQTQPSEEVAAAPTTAPTPSPDQKKQEEDTPKEEVKPTTTSTPLVPLSPIKDKKADLRAAYDDVLDQLSQALDSSCSSRKECYDRFNNTIDSFLKDLGGKVSSYSSGYYAGYYSSNKPTAPKKPVREDVEYEVRNRQTYNSQFMNKDKKDRDKSIKEETDYQYKYQLRKYEKDLADYKEKLDSWNKKDQNQKIREMLTQLKNAFKDIYEKKDIFCTQKMIFDQMDSSGQNDFRNYILINDPSKVTISFDPKQKPTQNPAAQFNQNDIFNFVLQSIEEAHRNCSGWSNCLSNDTTIIKNIAGKLSKGDPTRDALNTLITLLDQQSKTDSTGYVSPQQVIKAFKESNYSASNLKVKNAKEDDWDNERRIRSTTPTRRDPDITNIGELRRTFFKTQNQKQSQVKSTSYPPKRK